jgi:hypothetical protein
MIIEMLLPLNEDQTFVAAWEFSDKLWSDKEITLKKFINEIFINLAIKYKEKKWQENIIFELDAKPYHFYDLQDCFNDYFKSLGATIIVH